MDYNKYLIQFGEHGIQALLEEIEKVEHIQYDNVVTLEQRWERVMSNS